MLLSLRKNGLTSLFKEVRVFKGCGDGVAIAIAISCDGERALALLFCC